MHRSLKLRTAVKIGLLAALLACSGRVIRVSLVEKTGKPRRQLHELKALKQTILRHHGAPYLYVDSAALAESFDAAKSSLSIPRTISERYRIYSSLLAGLGCGHTQMWPSRMLIARFMAAPTSLPFDVKLVNGRLYTLRSYRQDSLSIPRGAEILAINGESVPQMLAAMRQYVSSDGDNTTLKDRILSGYFLMYYYITFGVSPYYELTVARPNGTTYTISIAAAKPKLINYEKKFPEDKYSNGVKSKFGTLRMVKNSGYAVLTIYSFDISRAKRYQYQDFLDGCFEKIRKSEVKNLILDLRYNGGGYVQNYLMGYMYSPLRGGSGGYPLSGTFSSRSINMPRHSGLMRKDMNYLKFMFMVWRNRFLLSWNKQLNNRALVTGLLDSAAYGKHFLPPTPQSIVPQPYVFPGQIYVLVNGRTFSAAAMLTSMLKQFCKAIVIGEETGGSYLQANTGAILTRMPYSHFRFMLNPIFVSFNVPVTTDPRRGVMPDYVVGDSPTGGRRNDPVMKKAIELIALSQAADSTKTK